MGTGIYFDWCIERGREIRRRKLDLTACHQCATAAEAFGRRWEWMAQGIESQVFWTDEFRDQSPIGRRTS